jgi:hypothetical protein
MNVVAHTNGTVLLRGKRVPAVAKTLTMKNGTGYTNIVRGTFTGRTVTCSPKVAATFLADETVEAPNDMQVSIGMIVKRQELIHRWTELIDRVQYRPDRYQFVVDITPGMKYPFVQLKCWRPDTFTGVMAWGGGYKAYPSEHASDSEFIQMLLGMAIAYEQHEVREAFLVDGDRAYGPHIDVEALLSICHITDARQQRELNR